MPINEFFKQNKREKKRLVASCDIESSFFPLQFIWLLHFLICSLSCTWDLLCLIYHSPGKNHKFDGLETTSAQQAT